MRVLCTICMLIAVFAVTSCKPTTFIVSKGNKAYYFGRESRGLKKMVCDSGDLKAVLRRAKIPAKLKDDFFRYVCTEKRSKAKVLALYTFLTPDEKKSLKRAFALEGYMINYVPC